MRARLAGYYPPTEEELTLLWQEGLFAFDASSILNLYRLPEVARTQMLNVMRKLQPRIWLPFQAALEYQRNRPTAIDSQWHAYDVFRSNLRKVSGQLQSEAQKLKRHPVLDPDQIIKLLDDFVGSVDAYLDQHKRPFSEDADKMLVEDPIRDAVTEMFSDAVGMQLSVDRLAKIEREGAQRYEEKVPPGFEDAAKPSPDRYGDLIIWEEILEHARSEQKFVVLVTDDEKDDWWWKFKGRMLGPRPELVQEFEKRCGGRMHMYTSPRFLEHASRFVGAEVSEDAIEAAEEAARQEPPALALEHWTPRALASLSFPRIADVIGETGLPPPLALRAADVSPARFKQVADDFNIRPSPVVVGGDHVELRFKADDVLRMALALHLDIGVLDKDQLIYRLEDLVQRLRGLPFVPQRAVVSNSVVYWVDRPDMGAMPFEDLVEPTVTVQIRRILVDLANQLGLL